MRLLSYPSASREPVSVDEAREACRLDDDALDIQIAGAITAARESAEQITGKRYRQAILRRELQDWPDDDRIELPVWQPTAFSVSYRSEADPTNWTTLPTTAYRAGTLGNGAHVTLAAGQSWPTLAGEEWGDRVRIDVTAGSADGADVPESVRLYIKAAVVSASDEPGALMSDRMRVNPYFDRMLDSERLAWA